MEFPPPQSKQTDMQFPQKICSLTLKVYFKLPYLFFSGAFTSTQSTQPSRAANFHLMSNSSSSNEETSVDTSTTLPPSDSPIFRPKPLTSKATVTSSVTATCSRLDTSSTSGQETGLKQNLVGYSDSFSEEHEVIDITGMSSNSEQRFKNPVSDSELKSLGGKTFAASTDRKIAWAKKLFEDWKKARNYFNEHGSIQVTLDDDEVNKSKLSTALCQFLSEVWCSDGHDYPGNTLYSIVVMLQLHFEKRGHVLKLIDDPEFVKVKNTLDNLMKKHAAERVSSTTKAADPISMEAKEQLWQQNILGSEDADKLWDTVMYLIGLTFALCGGKEHRTLRCPPFNLQIRVQYSKTHKGKGTWSTKKTPKAKVTRGGAQLSKVWTQSYLCLWSQKPTAQHCSFVPQVCHVTAQKTKEWRSVQVRHGEISLNTILLVCRQANRNQQFE